MERRNAIRRKRFGDGEGIEIMCNKYTKHLPCMKHCYCVTPMSTCMTIRSNEHLDS